MKAEEFKKATKGKDLFLFFESSRQIELDRISKLPPEEQRLVRESQRALAKRMNS